MPFEVPKGWVLVKIKDIFEINPKNDLSDETTVSFIPMTLISDGFSNKHSSEIKKWEEIKKGFTHFRDGDVGIAKITPCFENRKSVIFQNLENGYGAGTTELHILRPFIESFLSNYIIYFVKTEDFITNGVNCFTGAVGQQRIGKNIIEETYFPLPPLSEQHRIVQKIEKCFTLIDQIEESKLSLSQFVKQTKSKVLDLAIRGKLVSQDPNESITNDKLKITNKTSDIFPYNNDIEIPDNWKITTMQNICHLSDGENIDDKALPYLDVKYLRGKSETKILTSGKFVPKNSTVILVDGENSGEIFLIKEDGYQGSTFKILNISNFVDKDFIFRILQKEQSAFRESKVGSAIPHLDKKMFRELPVLLPPLAEQKRIVKRIESIFLFLDLIQNNL